MRNIPSVSSPSHTDDDFMQTPVKIQTPTQAQDNPRPEYDQADNLSSQRPSPPLKGGSGGLSLRCLDVI